MTTSFYSPGELAALGLKAFGARVLVSRFARLYAPEAIELGHDVRIDDFCLLSGGAGIRVGSHVHVSAYAAVYGAGGVVLEDFVGLSVRVTVFSSSDDFSGRSLTNSTVPEAFRPGLKLAPVRIGRHGLIGAGSTILPGVTVGEGAAVGAHSLVTHDCEAWTICTGCPARRLRARSRALLDLEREFLASCEPGSAPPA